MVGSITFTKKGGEYVQKGDEVNNLCPRYFLIICVLVTFFYFLFPFGVLTFINFQLGYFSFGGSTVICVFEKVSFFFFFQYNYPILIDAKLKSGIYM